MNAHIATYGAVIRLSEIHNTFSAVCYGTFKGLSSYKQQQN